jgi:hypothetical protein
MRLLIGKGFIENVPLEVWLYEVSGKQVIRHWFSYRKKDRARPLIGSRRPPSPLGRIQPDYWLPEYTTDLINLVHVLGQLVSLEPQQAELLSKICAGPLVSAREFARTVEEADEGHRGGGKRSPAANPNQIHLLEDD